VTWVPISLRELPARPPVKPTIGGLIYPGRRHVFSGPPESAKTFAAFCIAVDEIQAGSTVLHIDFEMFEYETRDRLRDMGLTGDSLDRFVHLEPTVAASDAILAELAQTWRPSLAIIDAAAGAYHLQGLDDIKRNDIEPFARAFIEPLRARGVATILIDHVAKRAEKSDNFSIGSERKIGAADVHLGFETVSPLGRGRIALVKITTKKDRFGYLPRPRTAELELRSDPSTHAVTWEFRQPSDADGWRPTALMEKVSRYLESITTSSEGRDELPRSTVESEVKGRAEFVRRAMDELIATGYAAERPGAKRARLIRSIRPFRCSSHLVPTSSESREPPVDEFVRPVPPLRADGDEHEVDADEVERLADLARGAT
jgi:AAA domain